MKLLLVLIGLLYVTAQDENCEAPGEVCRESQGPCDQEELCTDTLTCPPDILFGALQQCTNSTSCAAASHCDGTSVECPEPTYLDDSTLCSPSTGPCETDSFCTGSSPNCPTNTLLDRRTICYTPPSDGSGLTCDLPTVCNGKDPQCPTSSQSSLGVKRSYAVKCSDDVYVCGVPSNSTSESGFLFKSNSFQMGDHVIPGVSGKVTFLAWPECLDACLPTSLCPNTKMITHFAEVLCTCSDQEAYNETSEEDMVISTCKWKTVMDLAGDDGLYWVSYPLCPSWMSPLSQRSPPHLMGNIQTKRTLTVDRSDISVLSSGPKVESLLLVTCLSLVAMCFFFRG